MKNKIKSWHILLIFTILGVGIFLKSMQIYKSHSAGFEFQEQNYRVLLADTQEKAYKGLSDREDLGDYEGMLFLFNAPSHYIMVMRDMNFPIDIVWLNNETVVDIAPNAQPEPGVEERLLKEYRPRLPADAVLELRSGFTAEKGVKIGDKIRLLK